MRLARASLRAGFIMLTLKHATKRAGTGIAAGEPH
jgi:hypothetical protein